MKKKKEQKKEKRIEKRQNRNKLATPTTRLTKQCSVTKRESGERENENWEKYLSVNSFATLCFVPIFSFSGSSSSFPVPSCRNILSRQAPSSQEANTLQTIKRRI